MSQVATPPSSSGSTSQTFKPVYLVPDLGEYAVIPDGGITNIGGTSSPVFTVGGRALLFADGSSSDGSSGSININLQSAYNGSVPAEIDFVTGKSLLFKSVDGHTFQFNADTGEVTISGNLTVHGTTSIVTEESVITDRLQIHQSAGDYTPFVMEPAAGVTPASPVVDIKVANGGASVFSIGADGTTNISTLTVGLINGIDLGALKAKVDAHTDLTTTTIDHTAVQVSANTSGFENVTGSTVQQALASIDTAITNLTNIEIHGVRGFEFVQSDPLEIWTIVHSQNTRRVQVQIWDETDELIFADTVIITDPNTVTVTFNTAVAGRAILMLF